MWKKIGVALIALIGTCSVVYAVNQKLEAVSSYSIGGEVYGQIGAPTIGDRIYLGTKNASNDLVGWQLVDELTEGNGNANFVGNNSYLALSTVPLAVDVPLFGSNDVVPSNYQSYLYSTTQPAIVMDEYNSRLQKNTQDMNLIAERSTDVLETYLNIPYFKEMYYNDTYGLDAQISLGIDVSKWNDATFGNALNTAKAKAVHRIHYFVSELGYGVSINNNGSKVELTGHKVAYPMTTAMDVTNEGTFICANYIKNSECKSAEIDSLLSTFLDLERRIL